MTDEPTRGLVDTNVVILQRYLDPADLPDVMAISAVTLAELSAGVHHVREDDAGARDERARRLELLQQTENTFDPLPFDADAARSYGRVIAAVLATGRSPRRRVADQMIAAVAAANRLPLFTTNPDDYRGLEGVVEVVSVRRPTQVS